MMTAVFWDVASCRLADVDRRFRGQFLADCILTWASIWKTDSGNRDEGIDGC